MLLTFLSNLFQKSCRCPQGSASAKVEPKVEEGESDANLRRNTPRAARKRRSFSEIYDSDGADSDPEYDPRIENIRSGGGKRARSDRSIKSPVVNGTSSKSSKRASKSKKSWSPEPEEPKRRSSRDRKKSGQKTQKGNDVRHVPGNNVRKKKKNPFQASRVGRPCGVMYLSSLLLS